MAHPLSSPKTRFFDSNGDPLAGGKLYSYAAGTTTLQATYTDITEGVANANPVVLDASGEASIWIGSAAYKFVLKDSSDNTLWTMDNVSYLNASSVITSKIADSAVTTAKIADSNVTTAKINDAAVTTTKIADANVTTAKLADGSVTQAKRSAVGQQLSASSGGFSTTSTTDTDITNLSVTITTTGRPVFVGLISFDGSGSSLRVSGSGSAAVAAIQILRDATVVTLVALSASATGATSVSVITPAGPWTIDTPAAGTYTYKVQGRVTASTASLGVLYWKLIAFEL